MPSKITFGDGSTIVYLYGADGTKIRTTHTIDGTVTTTDYCGSVMYENGMAKHLLTQAGYVSLNEQQVSLLFARSSGKQPCSSQSKWRYGRDKSLLLDLGVYLPIRTACNLTSTTAKAGY